MIENDRKPVNEVLTIAQTTKHTNTHSKGTGMLYPGGRIQENSAIILGHTNILLVFYNKSCAKLTGSCDKGSVINVSAFATLQPEVAKGHVFGFVFLFENGVLTGMQLNTRTPITRTQMYHCRTTLECSFTCLGYRKFQLIPSILQEFLWNSISRHPFAHP